MDKLVTVLAAYAKQQVEAGADVIQVFDSWAGALSVADYRQYCLAPPPNSSSASAPSAYRSSTSAWTPPRCCPPCARPEPTSSASTGASRSTKAGAPLAGCAVQGNLDPITLFAPEDVLQARVREILSLARRPPRTHLQPRPRHRPRNTGGERAARRRVGQAVRRRARHRRPNAKPTASGRCAHEQPTAPPSCCSRTARPTSSARWPPTSTRSPAGVPCLPEVVAELQHRYAEIGLRDEPLARRPSTHALDAEAGRAAGETHSAGTTSTSACATGIPSSPMWSHR
jgi:hypothetical protein